MDKKFRAPRFRFCRVFLLLLLLLGLISFIGCAGSDAPVVTKSCEELNGMTVPAASIGLPTTGGVVTSTAVIEAAGTGAAAVPEYCKVMGEINSVDRVTPTKIKFQLNLPTTWNGKVVMFGGGGHDGSIPAVGGQWSQGSGLTPLQRGYATFGSDSGHQAGALGSQDHSFGLNEEAELNFAAGYALKKTRDASVYIINARYGGNPSKAYFNGGSTGGREALNIIQRWPADWNGAIAWYPAWNDMGAMLTGQKISRALAVPGAYPNQAKKKLIYDAAMAACDTLDGVADGLISNVTACNATFEAGMTALRCPGGADTGDTCLSDLQIGALRTASGVTTFNFYMASGLQYYLGANVWGTDLGRNAADAGNFALQAYVMFLEWGNIPPAYPMPSPNWATFQLPPYLGPFLDQFLKYAVVRDATGTFNTLTIDPENPGPYAARLSYLSTYYDTSTDISAFKAKGGKLLIAHGQADGLVPTPNTELYYAKLRDQFGTETDDFVRFYLIPGVGHAYAAAFTPAWDSLTTLEKWVEEGTAPVNQVVTDTALLAGRTRPLCDYPTWPKYNGTGDVNLASSFTCSLY